MLLIYVLIGIVVVAFAVVGWIVYAAKKEAGIAQEETAVPIVPLSGFKSASSAKEDQLGHLEPLPKAAVQGPVASLEIKVVGSPEFDTVPSSDIPVAAERKSLVVSAEEERGRKYEDDIRQLKEEVRLIREKAVIQAKNAIEVINKLRNQAEQLQAENQRLEVASVGISAKDDAIARLESERESLKEQLDTNIRGTSSLQAELDRQKASDCQIVEQLKAENELLKSASSNVDQERRRLSDAIRAEYQSQLDGLASRMEELRQEKEAILSSQGAPVQAVGEMVSVDEVASFRKAADVLREEKESLEVRIRELEALHARQDEKNSFLQYELTKSRAQAMGVERIYENSRKQIKDLARQVSDTHLDNKELKKQTSVLGQSLNDFKRLNTELLKREKLSQFEIEKSRGDLRDLERIYDGFRSRLEKVGLVEEEMNRL